MYRFNDCQVEKFLREKKLLGAYKEWVKAEEAKARETQMKRYFDSLSEKEKESHAFYTRLRQACGKTCRWTNIWMDKSDLGFRIYKGNRDKDFVYVVYDLATDTFSAEIPYVDDLNGFMLWKYNFVTGRKGRGGKKNGKTNV